MQTSELDLPLQRLNAPLPMWRASVDAEQWLAKAEAIRAGDGRLVSLWGSDRSAGKPSGALVVCAAYALGDGLVWLELPLNRDRAAYPDLGRLFPAVLRMQRAATDLLGIEATGSEDRRPWLDHGAWPARWWPLRHDNTAPDGPARAAADYPFVRVQGDGVHEIPVGPVHAGTI